jgi:hypothetical protein
MKREKRSAEQDRLARILQSTFVGARAPLKDMPTRSGESRAVQKPKNNPHQEKAVHKEKAIS